MSLIKIYDLDNAALSSSEKLLDESQLIELSNAIAGKVFGGIGLDWLAMLHQALGNVLSGM